MPHFGGIFLQKLNKTIFLITIVLVFLFCFTAVSANDEASIIGDSSSTDDIAVADVAVDASGDAQTIDNDVSYEADGIIVNDTGDSDRNSETVLGSGLLAEGESNSFTNLANSIANAGSYLPLSGNYAYDSTLDTAYVDGITISKDITINGGGTTIISGNDLSRIFKIENGCSVVLLDVTFINGKADNGGAIYNDGNLVLKDCEFRDNSADYGAAIYNTENGVLTGDADFTDNVAVYRGGGIYSEGAVDLSDSVFDSNDISYRAKNDDNGGAAIYNNGGTCNLDNVQVTNNLKNIVIRNGNAGDLINAAVFSSGRLYITDSYIANNSGSYGGGVFVCGDETFTVSGTTFENNMATFGAAIYDYGAAIIVENCIFNENHCEGVGSAGTSNTQAGAILVMSEGASATITDSKFNKNSAKTGGAVSISQASGDVLIDGCEFIENTASYEGGAIYNYIADGAQLSVRNSTFTDNTAASWGDAISNDAGLKWEANTISGDANTAIGNWLGTFDTNVKVTILDGLAHTVTSPVYELTATVTDDSNNPLMDHNFAFKIGEDEVPATYYASEGVYKATYTFRQPGTYTISTGSYEDADITTSVVTFESPLSTLQDLIDAAIANGESSLELDYGFAYIESHDAAAAATGIVIPSDFTIIGNGVTIDGGHASRIFTVNGGTLTLSNVTLANGKADDGAAVYLASDAKLDATSTTFKDNVATYSGGAIYTEGGEIVLTDSLIDNNDVEDATKNNGTGGAAIFAKNAQVTLVNTNVTNNGRRELDRTNLDLVDAVVTLKNTDVEITGGLFENNTGIYGGAIYAEGNNETTLTVTGATFNNNKAYNGAAIDITNMKTAISGSTFTNNFVVGPGSTGYYAAGGAIAAGGGGSFALEDSTFTANKATGEGAWAGAVAVGLENNNSASITGCTFSGNTATDKADSIFNYGYLSLRGNTMDTFIDLNGKLNSQVNIVINGNTTYTAEAFDNFTAEVSVTDDNGNVIRVNGDKIGMYASCYAIAGSVPKPVFDEATGLYKSSFALSKSGVINMGNLRATFPYVDAANVVVKGSYVNVTPAARVLVVTYDNITYPGVLTVSVSTTREKDGAVVNPTVKITINGVTKSISVKNGVGSVTFEGLAANDYIINASIAGTASYKPVEQLYNLTVFEKQGTFKDLQQKIDNADAGSTINLAYDIAYDAEYDGDGLIEGIIVNKSIVIAGEEGIEICGSDLARIFKVSNGATLTLNDVTICDGAAEKGAGVYVDSGSALNADGVIFTNNVAVLRGGAIYSEGTVEIKDSTIQENYISKRDGAGSENKGGAAIYNNGGVTTLDNVQVIDNLKDYVNGNVLNGAIVANGTTSIKNSYFKNNKGRYGGALTQTDTDKTLTVENTTFEDNEAIFGAAIYDNEGSLVVKDCKFYNNTGIGPGSAGTSSSQGGAILVMGEAAADISGSEFINNTADLGGAVAISSGATGTFTIDNCDFIENTANNYGGAIYQYTDESSIVISDSDFTKNSAIAGGAIFTCVGGELAVEDSTFTENEAAANNFGGAIYTQSDASVTGSTFTDNVGAGYGNALFSQIAGTTLVWSQNTVTGNDGKAQVRTQSGVILESPLKVKILNNDTVNIHMAPYNITAVVTDDMDNVIINLAFRFKVGETEVTGISISGATGIYQTEFTPTETGTFVVSTNLQDADEVQTGVLNIYRSLTDLKNLIDNAEEGAVIELDGDYSYIDEFDADLVDGIAIDKSVTINGNDYVISGSDTARLFHVAEGKTLTLNDVTLTEAKADKGAAVYVDAGAALNANNVNFTDNTATYRGGAIYSEGTVNVDTAVFDGNDITFRTKNDDNGGAAIYNLNGVLNVNKANITNNLKNIVIRNGNAGDLLVGVVVSSGETTVTDSYFANNTGSWGGAISSLGYLNSNPYTLTVTGTTFEGNNATFGGAIFVESSNLVVDDCTFIENSGVGVGSSGTSNTQGGAIVVFPNGAKATITGSNFTSNSANVGGAVSLAGVDQDSLIDDCIFTDNTASDGGAVYLWTGGDAAVTVKDSIFSGNTAGWGNAISTDGALKLEGNTISTTSADIGNYYGSIESKVIVQILGNDTTEGAGIVEATFGETVPIYAVITDDNGNLIKDISLVFTISSNAGTKSVEATYNDDTNKYEAEYDIESAGKNLVSITSSADEFLVINTGLIDVAKEDVTLTINVEDIHEGQKAVVTGQIIGIDDTGIAADIIVVVNDVDYNITTTVEENGTFSFEIPDLTAGNYGAFAIFLGDNNYNYGYASDLFNVKERQLAVVITNLDDLQNFVYGDQVTLDFTVTDAITGEAVTGADILITNYDDADISYKDEEGNYQVNLGMLKPGDYELSAFFKVEGYEPLTYEPINVKVSKADIDVIVNRINDTITYGQDETIFVGTNNTAFEGTISITLINYYNGTEIVSFNVTLDPEDDVVQELGGLLVDLSDLNAGKYNITAEFEGNDGYNADEVTIQEPYNTFEVKKAGTILIIEVPSVNAGDDIPISVLLYDEFNNPISGDVYLEVPGIETPLVVEVVNGEGELTVTNTLARNTDYEVTAVFRSTTNYEASDDSDKFDVIGLHTGIIIEPVEDISYGTETEGTFTIVDGEGNPIADFDEDMITVTVDDTPVDVIIRDGVGTYTIPANLAVGPHTVTVVFVGDNKYAGSDATATVVVNQASSVVTITAPSEIVYGDELTVGTELTSDGQAIAGDVAVVVTDASGDVVDDLTKLPAGSYTIKAAFAGNDNYIGSDATATVVVNPADVEVSVSVAQPIAYGENATVTITVTTPAGEKLNEVVDVYGLPGVETVTLADGTVTFDVPNLDAREYTIWVKFPETQNYAASSSNIVVFTVDQAVPVITVFDSTTEYGVAGTVNVTSDVSGYYYVTINGVTTIIEIAAGSNSSVAGPSDVVPGSYDVTVAYKETTNYAASSKVFEGKYVVTKKEETVVLSVNDVSCAEIPSVSSNAPDYLDENVVYMVYDKNGVEVYRTEAAKLTDVTALKALAEGTYTVAAEYVDELYDVEFVPAEFKVSKADSKITITAPSEITYGDELTVGTELTSGGEVIDGVVAVVVTDAEGNVVDLSKLDAGVYAITATFDGDDVYAGTEATATVVVKQAESSIVVSPIPEINAGETQSITVTVGPEGVDGTVKVIVTGEGYSFTHEYAVSELAEPITLSDLPAGDYSINAIFNVGSNYELSTASAVFTVKSTDVSAKVNATFINFGENVTVTIEGMPGDVPVSDLNITDNGKEIAVTLNGNEFVYAPAESGDHVIAINYNGTAYDKFYAETSFTVAPEGEYTVIPANNSAEAVQEAINNAPAGATIKLADNTTYDLAGIELNNSVTIVGGEGTVITVPAGQSSAFVAAANASDVNIKNIKFVATSDNQSLLSVTPNDLGGGISQVPAITIENVTAIPAAGVNESTISLLNVNTSSNPFKPSSDVSISKNIMASGVNSLKTNASASSGNVALKKAVQTTLTGANTQKVYAIPYKVAKSGKYYTVTLKDKNGNVLANKTVKFTLAGKTYTVKTDAKGVAKLAINIYKPGTYKLAVSFAGESTLGASSKQATIKILKNKVKITRKTKKVKRSAKKRTLKYYVKTKTGKKMGIKGVKVYLKINKKTYKAKTNKKGLVKFKVKLPRVKKTYKVKVTFKGNKANKKRTLKTKVKVY